MITIYSADQWVAYDQENYLKHFKKIDKVELKKQGEFGGLNENLQMVIDGIQFLYDMGVGEVINEIGFGGLKHIGRKWFDNAKSFLFKGQSRGEALIDAYTKTVKEFPSNRVYILGLALNEGGRNGGFEINGLSDDEIAYRIFLLDIFEKDIVDFITSLSPKDDQHFIDFEKNKDFSIKIALDESSDGLPYIEYRNLHRTDNPNPVPIERKVFSKDIETVKKLFEESKGKSM